MVAGFNTEIKNGDVVYHIQTETRRDAGIETSVYVGGAVVHSLKTSYQDLVDSPEYSDALVRSRVEAQHRQVIGQIRSGEIRGPQIQSPAAP